MTPTQSRFRHSLWTGIGFVLSLPCVTAAKAHLPIVPIAVPVGQSSLASSGSTKTANANDIGATPSAQTQSSAPPQAHVGHHRGGHHPVRHHGAARHSRLRHYRDDRTGDPRGRVNAANHAARMQPDSQTFNNAIQQYPYSDGALYQLYAAPGEITDIALQEGEQLAGTGPVAAGDTVRWIIGDTTGGTGATTRVHILVKPTRADLVTNLIINTDRRTYHLELHGTSATYMASLSWTYPQDQLIAIRGASAAAARAMPIADGIEMDRLNFGYAISGDKPSWRPLRAFDDGTHVYIEFPDSIAQGDMPPLFVLGDKGQAELVNYRVSGHHLIVDRLFATAELRLGDKHAKQTVKIIHTHVKVQ